MLSHNEFSKMFYHLDFENRRLVYAVVRTQAISTRSLTFLQFLIIENDLGWYDGANDKQCWASTG